MKKPIKTSLKQLRKVAKYKRKKISEMKTPDGKSIYNKISRDGTNYELFDLTTNITGFKRMVFNMNIIQPGKVGSQFKMTTGHSHSNQDEFYFFIRGKGKMVLKFGKKKYNFSVSPHDLVSVPRGYWHRVINTGKQELVFIDVFEGKVPKSRQ